MAVGNAGSWAVVTALSFLACVTVNPNYDKRAGDSKEVPVSMRSIRISERLSMVAHSAERNIFIGRRHSPQPVSHD